MKTKRILGPKSVQLTKLGVALARKLVPIVEGVDEDFFWQDSEKTGKRFDCNFTKINGDRRC